MSNPWPKIIKSRVAFDQIGVTVPPPLITVGETEMQGLKGVITYGDAIFFSGTVVQPTDRNTDFGLLAYRVKKDGTTCTYISSDIVGKTIGWCTGLGQKLYSPGLLQTRCYYTATTTDYLIPLTMVENTVGIVAVIPDGAPAGPCNSGGADDIVFFPAQGFKLIRYSQQFPDDARNFVRIVNVASPAGQIEVVNGYVGTYGNGQDGINRTSESLPPEITTAIGVFDGGQCSYQAGNLNFDSRGYTSNWHIGGTGIYLQFETNLTCDLSVEHYNTYYTSIDSYTLNSADAPPELDSQVNAVFKNSSSENPLFVCEMVHGASTVNPDARDNFMCVYSNAFYAELYPVTQLGVRLALATFVIFADGTVIALGDVSNGLPAPIYRAQIDLVSLGLVFQADVVKFHNAIINGNRPVSPNGSFIT